MIPFLMCIFEILYVLLCPILEAEIEGLKCHLYPFDRGEVLREDSSVLGIEDPTVEL